MRSIGEIEAAIQKVAEDRLRQAEDLLHDDADDRGLSGPYCGCDTCVVREVISAAWPHLYELAHHPETERP